MAYTTFRTDVALSSVELREFDPSHLHVSGPKLSVMKRVIVGLVLIVALAFVFYPRHSAPAVQESDMGLLGE